MRTSTQRIPLSAVLMVRIVLITWMAQAWAQQPCDSLAKGIALPDRSSSVGGLPLELFAWKGDVLSSNLAFDFKGETRIASDYTFRGQPLGGLSGIDYDQSRGKFIAISDSRGSHGPMRFYTLSIDLSSGAPKVVVEKLIRLLDDQRTPLDQGSADPESIRLDPRTGGLFWSSEGDSNKGISPFVRAATIEGYFERELPLPDHYHPRSAQGVRDNEAFESLSLTPSGDYLVVATEGALLQDGPRASPDAGSYARVLRYRLPSGEIDSEFAYPIDPVHAYPPRAGDLAINGLVEILFINDNQFLALERSFVRGVGNAAKLYLANLSSATNVSGVPSLKGHIFKAVDKSLLLDLSQLPVALDNLEGLAFAPAESGGKPHLVLVSDNNFSSKQSNQFLVFDIAIAKAP